MHSFLISISSTLFLACTRTDYSTELCLCVSQHAFRSMSHSVFIREQLEPEQALNKRKFVPAFSIKETTWKQVFWKLCRIKHKNPAGGSYLGGSLLRKTGLDWEGGWQGCCSCYSIWPVQGVAQRVPSKNRTQMSLHTLPGSLLAMPATVAMASRL